MIMKIEVFKKIIAQDFELDSLKNGGERKVSVFQFEVLSKGKVSGIYKV